MIDRECKTKKAEKTLYLNYIIWLSDGSIVFVHRSKYLPFVVILMFAVNQHAYTLKHMYICTLAKKGK